MSVPDDKLDPPVGDDCFDCLVEEIGSHDAACDVQENQGGYDGICPRHRAQAKTEATMDAWQESRDSREH
jgi:hypothetical protein